ncbi:hypothetical protein CQ12_23475 [Bradyrhizobium jicamae]|uniref:Uncharacterized protein n=1 Tax=Bradyrhizobium jicamae TaxID=280332 RepID=A0A0R3KU27_9BRAD|nr:hypothetical protein CQ12_23475 [Bradyrhizobium jicamae]
MPAARYRQLRSVSKQGDFAQQDSSALGVCRTLVAITTKVGLNSQIVGQQSQDLLFGVQYNLMLASTTSLA